MQQASDICKSVFKNGEIDKKTYTAVWGALVERLVQGRPMDAGKAGNA